MSVSPRLSVHRAALVLGTVLLLIAPTCAATAAVRTAAAKHRPNVDLVVDSGYPKLQRTINVRDEVGGVLDVQINNNSSTAAQPKLALTLPRGWRAKHVYPADGDHCAKSGTQYVCRFASLSNTVIMHKDFLIYAPSTAAYGVTKKMSVHVSPIGAYDPNTRNNGAPLFAVNKGSANLVPSVKRSASTVAAGKRMYFDVTLTNRGPDPATSVSTVWRVTTNTHNGFRQSQPQGPGTCFEGSPGPVVAGKPYTCTVDELDVGKSIHYRVPWRGVKPGASGHLTVVHYEYGFDKGAQHSAPGMQLTNTNSAPVTVH